MVQKLSAVLAVAALSLLLMSQSKDVTKVESILDKLEERLLQQEGESFSIKGRRLSEGHDKTPSFGFKGQTIYSEADDLSKVKDIGEAIGRLEQQVDDLTAEVHRSKQHVIELARLSNHVAVVARLKEANETSLQYLAAFVDDYEVYRVEDTAGMWLPEKSTPIFSGPMTPGIHKLKIVARLALRSKQGIPLQTPVLRTIDQTFDVPVVTETSNQKLAIDITVPNTLDGKATATLNTL